MRILCPISTANHRWILAGWLYFSAVMVGFSTTETAIEATSREVPALPDTIRQQKPPAPPNLAVPDQSALRERLLLLRQFLSLPSARLAEIRHTIETLEKMSPAERTALLISIERFLALDPADQEWIASAPSSWTPQQQHQWRTAWLSLSPEARQKERARILAMVPAQRDEARRAWLASQSLGPVPTTLPEGSSPAVSPE